MPIHSAKLPGGGTGYQWGNHGHVYPTRAGAERQAEAAHAHGYAGDGASLAAGAALRAPDGRLLFLKRAAGADHAGKWCFPGGMAEPGEEAEEAARREVEEETGYRMGHRVRPLDRRFSAGALDFATFAHDVPDAFSPKLNGEHTEFSWAHPGDPPQPLHPGVAATLAHQKPAQDAERDDGGDARFNWGPGDLEIVNVGAGAGAEEDDEIEEVDPANMPAITKTVHIYEQ